MLESSSRVFKWAHHVPYSPLPFIRNHPAIRMILVENPLPVLAIKRSCCILDDERKCHINHPEEASSIQIRQTMGNTIPHIKHEKKFSYISGEVRIQMLMMKFLTNWNIKFRFKPRFEGTQKVHLVWWIMLIKKSIWLTFLSSGMTPLDDQLKIV